MMFKCSLRFEEINFNNFKRSCLQLLLLVFKFQSQLCLSSFLSASLTYLSVSVSLFLCVSLSFCVFLSVFLPLSLSLSLYLLSLCLYSPSYPYFIESVVLWIEPMVFLMSNHFPIELNLQPPFFFLVWFHFGFLKQGLTL